MKTRIIFLVIVVLIAAMVVGGMYLNKKAIDDAYNYAITLIQNGSYEGGLGELEKANPDILDRDEFKSDMKYGGISGTYKNTIPLYAYSLAQLEYNSEEKYMHTVNDYLELIPTSYGGELCEEIKIFKEQFKAQYDEYVVEEKRKAEEERQKQIQETKKRLKNSIPYVGMSESYINYTLMGNYHDKEHVVVGKGKRTEWRKNEYRWKNSSGKTILYVECRDGSVTDVTKYWENKYWTADGRPIYSGTRSGYSSYSTGKKKVYNGDSYNVHDYYDAEDFYEDYYDDFYDYEEAEDYYNEHHD